MRKKTIARLFIIGVILFIIGYVLTFVGASNDSASLASLGLAVYAIGGIIYFVSWIGTLVALGKQGSWVWFVLTFLFSPLVELIYLFAGPGL
jgi:hypothetical protein